MSEWSGENNNCTYGHVKAGSCECTSERLHELARNTKVAEFDNSFPR
jgi:hypothetical protein